MLQMLQISGSDNSDFALERYDALKTMYYLEAVKEDINKAV